MAYTIEIADGQTWRTLDPDFRSVEASKDEVKQQIYARISVSGNIIIFNRSGDYDFIKAMYDAETYKVLCRITLDGVEMTRGYMFIGSGYNEDTKTVVCQITETIDRYLPLLREYDTKRNVLMSFPAVDCSINTGRAIEYKTCTYSFWQFESPESGTCNIPIYDIFQPTPGLFLTIGSCVGGSSEPDNVTLIASTRYVAYNSKITRIQCSVISAVPPVGTFWSVSVETVWAREFILTPDIGGEKNIPANDPGREAWLDIDESVPVGDLTYHKFVRTPFVAVDYGEDQSDYDVAEYQLLTTDIFTFESTRGRRLDNVIKYIVGLADDTLLFDDSGTDTDSFYYLKSYAKDGDNTLANMLMFGITDLVPTGTGGEPDTKQTILEMSLSEVMEYLFTFKLFFDIEERIGGDYFVLRHWSEINKTAAATPNFTEQSKKLNQHTTSLDEIYRRVVFNTIALNPDFMSIFNNIEIEKLFDVTEAEQDLQLNKFYTDIQAFFTSNSLFPETGTQNAFMLACDPVTTLQTITDITNSGYDNFTYTGNLAFDAVALASIARANISPVYEFGTGTEIEFYINANLISGDMPQVSFLDYETGSSLETETIYNLSSGDNQIDHTTLYQNTRIFIRNNANESVDFEGANIILRTKTYQSRLAEGIISGLNYVNNDLSLANVIREHFLYNMPSNEVVHDGDTITVDKGKLKLMAPVLSKLKDINAINFNDLITVEQGESEPVSFRIKLIKGTAEYIGRM